MLKPLIPVGSLALVLLLSGCGDPTTTPSPPPSPSSTPVFASDEEALAAAEEAYAAYSALEDAIAQAGGVDPQRLAPFVTSDWLEHEVKSFDDFRATGHKQVGSTSIGAVELQRSDASGVAVYVCLDFSATSFVDAQGRPVATSSVRSATIEAVFEIADSGLILSGSEPWSESIC